MDVAIVWQFRGRFVYFVDCSECGLTMTATLNFSDAEIAKIDHLIEHDIKAEGVSYDYGNP